MTDWNEVTERALAGDRAAYAKLARLVTGYLARWRAYDFRADWEDMVQDVLISTIATYREGRLANSPAFQAYVRQVTRFKFIDRIRVAERRDGNRNPEAEADRGRTIEAAWPPEVSLRNASVEMRLSVRRAIAALGDRERIAVLEVYLRGRSYDEAADATGIPLGSLKRALRAGLNQLREVLNEGPLA